MMELNVFLGVSVLGTWLQKLKRWRRIQQRLASGYYKPGTAHSQAGDSGLPMRVCSLVASSLGPVSTGGLKWWMRS